MILLLVRLALITQLGDEEAVNRERAEVALSAHVRTSPLIMMPLLNQARFSQDPEISRRVNNLRLQALDAVCLSFEPVPEIDAGWYDAYPKWWSSEHTGYKPDKFRGRYDRMYPFLVAAIGEQSHEGNYYPWANYFLATRNWLRYEVESGTDIEYLRELLIDMRARDAVFLRNYRNPVAPERNPFDNENGIPHMMPPQ